MTTAEKYNVDPAQLVGYQHRLQSSDWSAWFLLWRYASDHGLLTRELDQATDRAEQQKPVSERQLRATYPVINHALKALGCVEGIDGSALS